jgi:O-antigen/teichoic acid export membrane protein
MTPLYGALDEQGSLQKRVETWLELSRWIQIIQVYMAVHMLFLGKSFISIWMGAQYAEGGKWVLWFLAVLMIVDAISPNSTKYLVGVGRHKVPARMLLLFSILCLTAAALLMPGRTVAVLAAVLLVTGSVTTFYLLRLVCVDLGISVAHHVRTTFMPVILPMAVTGCLLRVLQEFMVCNRYLVIVEQGCLGTLCYGWLAWFFVLRHEERLSLIHRCYGLIGLARPGGRHRQT